MMISCATMHAVYATFRRYLRAAGTYGRLRKERARSRAQKVRSPISPRSSASTSRCRTTPAASAFSPGDHCKSASDLDLPFIALTLLYRHGYFRQQIDKEGMQQSVQLNQNFSPSAAEAGASTRTGKPLFIKVEDLGRPVQRQGLASSGGRPHHALSCWIPTCRRTREEDRLITAQLYGGDDGDADQAGDRARDRRRPRAAMPRASARRLPHERRALGLSFARADPPAGDRRTSSTSAPPSRSSPRAISSPRTRRCRRATTRSRSS